MEREGGEGGQEGQQEGQSDVTGVLKDAYNAMIGVCGSGNDWQGALSLLRKMESSGVRCCSASYKGAIAACANAGEWDRILGLMEELEKVEREEERGVGARDEKGEEARV